MEKGESVETVTALDNESHSIRKSLIGSKRRTAVPSMMVCESAQPEGQVLCLHPMNNVGIDTCSARSVSSEASDFLYLDSSESARSSVELNGVGSGGPVILGRGPMLVSTLDSEGRQTFMVDPAGVLVESSENQSRLRIYGQQRMKKFGYHVVQDFSSGEDYLNYRDLRKIPLTTMNGILMVETCPWNLDDKQMERVNKIVDEVVSKSLDHFCFQLETEVSVGNTLPCLVMNVAKLARVEQSRIIIGGMLTGLRLGRNIIRSVTPVNKANISQSIKGTLNSKGLRYQRIYRIGACTAMHTGVSVRWV